MTKQIVIVEDEAMLRDVYALILTKHGYAVYTAVNGADGLEVVRRVKPDLVLLDVLMPIMDGRDFLKNMDLAEYPEMTVIVCSNNSEGSLQQEMIELGAHEVVLKASLSPTDLVTMIGAHLD